MTGLTQKLSLAAAAGLIFACAHEVKKAEIPPTAAPAEEIVSMESDLNSALNEHYDVLAPREFSKAQSWLKEAREDLRTGQKQEEILDDIGYARAWLRKSQDLAEGRRDQVRGILEAREAAINAGARSFPKEHDRIGRVDDQLRKVSGERSISADRFNRLQNSYLDIELNAIQDAHLGKAQAMVTGARRNGAEKNTPRTLKKAELDLTNAYNMIAADRHHVRSFEQAVEKANQSARLLTEVLAASKRGGKTVSEDVALDLVRQGRQLAGLKGRLSATQAEQEHLKGQLTEQEQQLGEAEAARRFENAFKEARREFKKEEAEVYREGDKLLIRLKAMKFPIGKSDLPPDSLPLLSKVKGIAEELNPQQVVVEGHTDSTGSAQLNQMLSQERAQSVARYLETNGLESEKIQAVGQGYQRPLASNKTKAGRAKNRRVDVIITPSRAAKSPEEKQEEHPERL